MGAVILYREFETETGGRLHALDITGEVHEIVQEAGINHGNALVFSPHTTCCILLASRGNGTIHSLAAAMDRLAPEDAYYAHDDLDIRTENLVDDEPANAPAHIAHVFIGKPSECLPVIDGRVQLGDGQRVFFVELDSSRSRRYTIQVVGQ
jgi:secondary thiamine-phosphate synthase enzyme